MSDDEQKKIFSKNLSNILNQHNKTQKEVADAIGVSPQTFNTWIQGIAIPRMGKVQLLADYFGIIKSDLIESKSGFVHENDNFPTQKQEIMKYYDTLNSLGKEKLHEYAEDLSCNPKYIEDTQRKKA